MEVTGRIIPPEERLALVPSDHPVLRRPADAVRDFDDALGALLDKMANTMYHEGGVGLAAPQVGEGKRVVVTHYGEERLELVNPEIVTIEGTQDGYEGCLSVPGYMGEVQRPAKVRVRYFDRRGRKSWVDAEGWPARVLSHELDHLDGGLFIECSTRVLRLRPEKAMRIVFMGTPEFAAIVLDALLEEGYKVVGVVTAPDRPRGRGQRVHASPVKDLALEGDIPVLQPESRADDEELAQYLAWLEPDLLITAAYGRILPRPILDVPRIGAINVHASLLPRYRGAAPIQRQILAGEETSGITIYWMDEGMDSGPVIHRAEMPLRQDITAGELHDELADLGSEALLEALEMIGAGDAPAEPQDESRANLAPKIVRGENRIDWQRRAVEVERRIRAFCPRPGAEALWRGRRLKILEATVEEGEGGPGEVLEVSERGILVGTGNGLCRITRLQPEGKRPMSVNEFVLGYDMAVGEVLQTDHDDQA